MILPLAVLVSVASADSVPSPNTLAARTVEGNTIVSPVNPPLRIRVHRDLPYVGRLTFRLKDVAEVERFVYARRDPDGRVRDVVIAQFESLLPAAKKGYSFAIEDTTLFGGLPYQTNTGWFNFTQAAAAKPGFEADRTRQFLAERGFQVGDDDFLAARYARITDATKRHELILFYYENARERGIKRADLEPGGSGEKRAAALFEEIERQARARIEVLD